MVHRTTRTPSLLQLCNRPKGGLSTERWPLWVSLAFSSKPEVASKASFWSPTLYPWKPITSLTDGWLAMVPWEQNMSWASLAVLPGFGFLHANKNARMWLGILNKEKVFCKVRASSNFLLQSSPQRKGCSLHRILSVGLSSPTGCP